MIYPRKCPMCSWEECIFWYCWVECSDICLLCPNASLDTDKDCVKYVDNFRWEVIATLTVLAVLIHEHGMSFLSLRSLKMSLNSVYYVQNTSLVLLLLSLFLSTLFCCIYKWYCFLNFIFCLFIANV